MLTPLHLAAILDPMEAKKLLICDDSATARRMLAACLPKDRPFEVVQVDRGEKAIEEYKKARPDLVLLDLTMPEMSGYEVLEALRKLDPTANVVIVSADVQDEARKRVIDAGAAAYVAKPMDVSQMTAILKSHGG